MLPNGFQPPSRYRTKRGGEGSLRHHAIGCTVAGGPGLPKGVCRKCVEGAETTWESLLARADKRARR